MVLHKDRFFLVEQEYSKLNFPEYNPEVMDFPLSELFNKGFQMFYTDAHLSTYYFVHANKSNDFSDILQKETMKSIMISIYKGNYKIENIRKLYNHYKALGNRLIHGVGFDIEQHIASYSFTQLCLLRKNDSSYEALLEKNFLILI